MTDNSQESDERRGPNEGEARMGYRLWQAQHAVERAMDEALKPARIGVTQVAALLQLQRQPGLSGAELARRLLITPQSTATLLAGLEKRGWIKRAPHAIHRSLIEATLTDAGKQVLGDGVAVIKRIDLAITDGMTGAERDSFGKLLDRCLANALRLTD